MSYVKKAEELAFNRKYSRFKLQVYFKKRLAITHFGQERYHCTVSQIQFGHAKEVILNREKGFQDCIDRLQLCEQLYGAYQTALIYDRRKKTYAPDGSVISDRIVRKYLAGQLVEWEENIFGDDAEKIIITTVRNTLKDNVKIFDLVPVIKPVPNIDFKTEIEHALSKKDNNQTTDTGQHH